MHSMGRRIVAEAAKRLAPSGGTDAHRPDLYLADHQAISADAQRVLIGWSQRGELPAVEAIENFVLGQFNGMVRMDHAALLYYPQSHALSVVLAWMAPTRRIDDAKSMVRVAPNRFVEGQTQQVWEVRNADDGTPFLVRLTDENLDALLAERQKKTQARMHQRRATFATIREAGHLVVDAGDEVRFHFKGLTKQGTIQRFDGEKIVIKSGDQLCKVAAPAVVEVVQKDPKMIGDYKARTRDYWSKIFPAEYLNKWLKAGEAEVQDPQ